MKASFTHSALVAFILVAVVLLVMVVFGQQLFEFGEKYANEGECNDQIQKSINARIGGISAPIRITCPTHQHEFAKVEDAVIAQVSDALVACWKRWHEGEQEVFDAKMEVYCDICSTFKSTNEVTIVGFNDALKLRSTAEMTVSEYLQSVWKLDSGALRKEPAPVPDEFTTDKPYAAVFRYIRAPGASFAWKSEVQFVPFTRDGLQKLGCTELPVGQTLPDTL